jgi:hypothetical protein
MCALARCGHHLLQPVVLRACLTPSALLHVMPCMMNRTVHRLTTIPLLEAPSCCKCTAHALICLLAFGTDLEEQHHAQDSGTVSKPNPPAHRNNADRLPLLLCCRNMTHLQQLGQGSTPSSICTYVPAR